MGGSYGGYMTNWLVGHTDRFRAAVAMNSMSNLYSGTGTSDIDYMDHSVTAGKNPWEDVEYFMGKSPISYVENVVTPLLLIHSSEDYRCPMDNAEQLFTALKKLRKTTEFVIFPGSHGFGRIGKPKHRVQRLQHMLRWFDRYL
jgi:dipeptidyl aminopeptidase/acylaminoacyl peptidase